MQFFKTKAGKLPGTNYKEIWKHAWIVFDPIKKRTKRKPYVRSPYFNKQKVFFDFFWVHMSQKKNPRERARRLAFFACAVDLIKNNKYHPTTEENPNKRFELLHRFAGITQNAEKFYVQIKEHKRTGTKQLMSVFPAK